MSELRTYGSQAMGTAMAIKEEFSRNGVDASSERMESLLSKYNFGDDVETLRQNLQIVLNQTAAFYRGLMHRL